MSSDHHRQDINSVVEGVAALILWGLAFASHSAIGLIPFVIGCALLWHAIGDYD